MKPLFGNDAIRGREQRTNSVGGTKRRKGRIRENQSLECILVVQGIFVGMAERSRTPTSTSERLSGVLKPNQFHRLNGTLMGKFWQNWSRLSNLVGKLFRSWWVLPICETLCGMPYDARDSARLACQWKCSTSERKGVLKTSLILRHYLVEAPGIEPGSESSFPVHLRVYPVFKNHRGWAHRKARARLASL
jgi:hypothetical protein